MEIEQSVISRIMGMAIETRQAHNPKVVGSNPTPATNAIRGTDLGLCLLIYHLLLTLVKQILCYAHLLV